MAWPTHSARSPAGHGSGSHDIASYKVLGDTRSPAKGVPRPSGRRREAAGRHGAGNPISLDRQHEQRVSPEPQRRVPRRSSDDDINVKITILAQARINIKQAQARSTRSSRAVVLTQRRTCTPKAGLRCAQDHKMDETRRGVVSYHTPSSHDTSDGRGRTLPSA